MITKSISWFLNTWANSSSLPDPKSVPAFGFFNGITAWCNISISKAFAKETASSKECSGVRRLLEINNN